MKKLLEANEIMKQKLFSHLSTITLIIGALIGGYALVSSFIFQSKYPGTCPITDNRPIIYISIAFLVASFILTIFEQRRKKAAEKKDKENDVSENEDKSNKPE